MNKKVLFIGNINNDVPVDCGQRTKSILLKNVLINEGFDLTIVDLLFFKRNPFSTINKIKKGIKECNIIFIVPGPRSAHFIIPLINHYNKKYKRKFIYCAVGTGYISEYLWKRKPEFSNVFFSKIMYEKKANKRDCKALSKIDISLFETKLILDVHIQYYCMKNCFILENFRTDENHYSHKLPWDGKSPLNVCYCSRICEQKGIFDLLKVVKRINKLGKHRIKLDIFGKTNALTEDEESVFKSYCNGLISYKGFIRNDLVIQQLSNYDMFCFPSKYVGEGTPGVISESLIAGTPVLCSNFFQAKYILADGVDSCFFDLNNENDLFNKMIFLLENPAYLNTLLKNVEKTRQKFLYSYQRDYFLSFFK